MMDFSREAQAVVEAVQAAMWEVGKSAVVARDPKPTPFQRAVIGGLVLIAHAALPVNCGAGLLTSQSLGAAFRAIAPFLDEPPVPE